MASATSVSGYSLSMTGLMSPSSRSPLRRPRSAELGLEISERTVLPPLRERKNDVSLLAKYFLKKFAIEQEKKIDKIDPEAMRLLLDYRWPGNIRELENSIEHAVTLSKSDKIFISDLPNNLIVKVKTQPTKRTKVLTANEENLDNVVFLRTQIVHNFLIFHVNSFQWP